MRLSGLYILLYFIYVLPLPAQQKTILLQQKDMPVDSLQKLIQQENLLQTLLYTRDSILVLSGKKMNDTLQVFIEGKNYSVFHNNLEVFLTAVNDSLLAQGQIFNRLKPEKISLENDVIHLFYSLEHTKHFVIDSLVYADEKFPRNLRKLLFRKFKGKQISRANMSRLKKFIRQNTAFEVPELPAIVFSGNKPWARIVSSALRTNTIEGALGLGYAPDSRKLQLQGSLHAILYNVFKAAETAKIDWQSTGERQILELYVDLPFIAGTHFSVDNRLSTGRHDTLQAFFYDKLQVKYAIGAHTLKLGFATDRQNAGLQRKYNYLTTGYQYLLMAGNYPQLLNIDIQYDVAGNNFIGFGQMDIKNHTGKFLILHNVINLMYNDTGNPISQTAQSLGFYRKFDHIRINSRWITAFKNELIWKKNELNIYVLGDFIREKSMENFYKTYINTGFGLQIDKKKQILTFELVKPIAMSYFADYQSVYLNIKQQFKF